MVYWSHISVRFDNAVFIGIKQLSMKSPTVKKSIWILTGMGIVLLACYFYIGPANDRAGSELPSLSPSASRDQAIFYPVVNIRENWWESAGTVYYDISARIVFQIKNHAANKPESVARAAWTELDRIGRIFNPFDPVSDLSMFNNSRQQERIPVSGDITAVLAIARQLWLESNGFFDPTAWRIKRLWLDAEKQQVMPSESDIAAVLKVTGFDKIDMDDPPGRTVGKTNPEVALDFGGIVKGYAVDQVCRILGDAGVRAGLVQLGGEISAFGDNDGNPWRIGIQHPTDMEKLYGVISRQGPVRVSTSGNYRQPLRIGNHTFYHIFNPKTGRPASDEILGVTTADFSGHVSSAVLDGAATAVTAMGPSRGIVFARRLGIETLILYEKADGDIGEHRTEKILNDYETHGK